MIAADAARLKKGTTMKRLVLTGIAALLLATGTARAQNFIAEAVDEIVQRFPNLILIEDAAIYYPYKKDGAHRDWFLQAGIAKCIKNEDGLGSRKEVSAFCECKFLSLADTLTGEDETWWYENQKVSAQFLEKADQATSACKHHFSKLPKVPERKKL
jgi:hypothetical protein